MGAHALPPLLASRSPRRAALLRDAGIGFEQGPAPDLDETPPPGLGPAEVAEHLAREKARAVLARRPGRTVLAADTVVALGSRLFGTPRDVAEAEAMLTALAGREHDVVTGVAVARDDGLTSGVARARVAFDELSPDEIRAYAATGEPLDKAGAYALQGGAARFARLVAGRADTVVGLPIDLVRRLLSLPPSDSR